MKAVILAAGIGKRIAAASNGLPKAWLPLDGQPGGPTFLDWHVSCLQALGVEEIILVGSRESLAPGLPTRADGRVRWLLNPATGVGSAHSAHCAWDDGVLDGRSRVLLMDADIIYDPALLKLLLDAPGERSKILVHADFRDTNEEVMVFGPADAPVLQGKGLLRTPMVEGLACLGEATGILLWEPGDHAALRAASDWCLNYATARKTSEHEDVTNCLLRKGRLQAVLCPVDAPFMECDTPEEYEVLKSDFYPRMAGAIVSNVSQGLR